MTPRRPRKGRVRVGLALGGVSVDLDTDGETFNVGFRARGKRKAPRKR